MSSGIFALRVGSGFLPICLACIEVLLPHHVSTIWLQHHTPKWQIHRHKYRFLVFNFGHFLFMQNEILPDLHIWRSVGLCTKSQWLYYGPVRKIRHIDTPVKIHKIYLKANVQSFEAWADWFWFSFLKENLQNYAYININVKHI